MEINGVNSKAYTSAAAKEEQEVLEKQPEVKEYGVAKPQKKEEDVAKFTVTEFDEDDVEEKANNYLQNILFAGGLTPESQELLQGFLKTFDVENFIKSYGPFSSAAEVSAAMYAVTAGMIKHPDNE